MDRPQTSWQACLSAAGRPVVASLSPVRSLPPLFLWASEGDVRHFGPPSKPSRQPAGLLRALCGLSEACPFSSPTGPARKRSCRPQLGPESFFYGLPKATLETHGPRPQTPQLAGLPLSSYGLPRATLGIVDRPQTSWQACFSAAGRPVVASLWPVRSLPPLFLWASEGDVRHFGPPSKPSRQPASLPRPLCGLRPPAPPANVPAGRSLVQKAFSMGFRRRR